jgi:hypothetical protein
VHPPDLPYPAMAACLAYEAARSCCRDATFATLAAAEAALGRPVGPADVTRINDAVPAARAAYQAAQAEGPEARVRAQWLAFAATLRGE